MRRYPECLDLVDDELARAVLDTLEAAAECGALPGFSGDPRGLGVIEAWRRERLGEERPAVRVIQECLGQAGAEVER